MGGVALRFFAKLGVSITPAVVLDGKVVLSGKALTLEELRKILSEYQDD